MIRKIYSTCPTFKNSGFSNGINLFVADKTNKSTDKQTRNSAGKSTIIDIVHFIFGADIKDRTFAKNEKIKDTIFHIELEQNDSIFTVSRDVSKPSKIFFDKTVDKNLFTNLKLKKDEGTDLFYTSNTEWKKAIGTYYFSIPEIDSTYIPSFRAILSYFVRLESSGGMGEPSENSSRQNLYDQQINLSFLFGLDWTLSQKLQISRDKEKTLRELKKTLKDGVLGDFIESSASLRSKIALLEGKVKEIQSNIQNFNLLPEYKNYEIELIQLNFSINDKINKNTIDKELLKSIQDSITEASSPSYESLEKLYQETLSVFPLTVKKRFDEVEKFNDSVIRNRKLYLEAELNRLTSEIDSRNKEIEKLAKKQKELMNLLKTHGALEQYTILTESLVKKQSELEDLKKKQETALDIENMKPRLEMERAELSMRMNQNIAENEENISNAVQRFGNISSELFEDAGLLTVENTQNGIKIGVSKQGDRSKGINSMQIYCFDMTMITILKERGENIDFLIHDSHLFEAVDSRQVAKALEIGKKLSEQYDFQYIVTMNSDQIPYEHLSKDFDVESIIVEPRLTDTDDGCLFGFRF